MKLKTILIFALLFFSFGCSQKSSFLKEDKEQQSAMMYTKKGELYNSLEIKASIVSTYLNPTQAQFKDSKEEVFLISIFIDNDSSNPKFHGIYNPDYTLTLNGKKSKSIKKLEFEDDLIKMAPIRNRWSVYYLVSFDKTDDEKLVMNFKNDAYGEVVLEYSKAF